MKKLSWAIGIGLVALVLLFGASLVGVCSDPSNKLIIKGDYIKVVSIIDKNGFTRADYNNPKIDDEFDAFFKDEIWIIYNAGGTRVTKMGCGPMEVY